MPDKSEIEHVIDTGDIGEVVAIVQRLQGDLPDYGLTAADDSFGVCRDRIALLEMELAERRAKLREIAHRILKKVERNWNAEEIQAATGYTA